MLICISSVLTSDELSTLRDLMSSAEYVDGARTAGWMAGQVKKNLQLAATSPAWAEASGIVDAALCRNQIFALAAMPRSIRPILFSRYEAGMSYGLHVDNALMGNGPQTRSDLAFTLFLNEPQEYEGGELIIEDPGGEREFKLPAGSIVLYPASTLHRIAVVKSGYRQVAVSWVQSLVRSHERRQILFELETVRTVLFQKYGKSDEVAHLTRSTSNLWRMWAEP